MLTRKSKEKKCLIKEEAEALYNAGYRKIDEGSIMWTKAEHKEIMQSLQRTLTNATLLKCIIKQKEEEARQARKETATEILQELHTYFTANIILGYQNKYKCIKYVKLLQEIAKKYGVEL